MTHRPLIYLDNNSTTPVADDVIEAMRPCWRDQYGNPSSLHRAGQAARNAIETARERVAALIGAQPREIIFTSGGTESDNLAILGTLEAYPRKKHVVASAVEHVAVLSLCEILAARGCEITLIPVDSLGRPDLDALRAALRDDTAIVSIMHANNETGVIMPIEQVAELTQSRGVPLHVDAVQSCGKLPIDVTSLGANLMSLSAHKIHGPKGVGALWLGRRARLRAQHVGGHQERDIRPGTENLAGIVGFGAAATLAAKRLDAMRTAVAPLRDRLERGILAAVDRAHPIGDLTRRIANTTNIGFEGLEAEAILISLSERGICVSSGSACSSGSLEPSHVLKAMGIDEKIAHGAIRFSLSHETTQTEIDETIRIVGEVNKKLAELSTPQ